MGPQKIIISIVLIVAVIGGIIYLNSQKADRSGNDGGVSVVPRFSNDSEKNPSVSPEDKAVVSAKPSADEKTTSLQKSKKYPLAKEITTPDGFINTDEKPVTIGEFVGKKVVLIDFWTYSCINCQRTTPYLNAWYEKYKDKGLVIIGIHTPEFEFEKVYQNVLDATKKEGIKYPVVLDNDYSTWNAYQNRFWPRKYLIDIDGYIVYDHIGEGAYEETEKKIQEALSERMAVLGESGAISQPLTKEILAENGARSPETYFGSARNDQQKNLLFPNDSWDITSEFAQNNSANASIVYTYTAKDVFFVAEAGIETVVEVLLDGKPLEAGVGADIIKTSDGKSVVKIKEARLYKIIQGDKSETHKLEMRIQKPGLKVFTFTFG
ncbi:MAG: redoxin family protein [Candidatus Liptonbacteria bacterium]|nr:redoxin family protein [Candidatus Liptonbacteria bacterium]